MSENKMEMRVFAELRPMELWPNRKGWDSLMEREIQAHHPSRLRRQST